MSVKYLNEEFLLSGCKRNDRRSQESLYKLFAGKMYAICLSYAGERPLAQDILQESFIKVFRNIDNYKNDGSLEGWIRRIVANTAIDHIRKKKREGNYIDIEPGNQDLQAPDSVLKMIGFNELMQQVERLPEGARMIFNMHALDGYSHKEIAERLNITEGTSKSQFSRARKLLMNFISHAGF